jgi:hypothetical protein
MAKLGNVNFICGMRKLLLSTIAILIQLSAIAQMDSDDIEFIQSVYGKNKRTIIQQMMTIEQSRQQAFWQLYDDYEIKRKEILRERFDIINQYALQYDSLDDKKALHLINELMTNTGKTNKLCITYIKKFENIVGGLNTALLFQIEEYLKTAFQAELQANIPLINNLHTNGEY